MRFLFIIPFTIGLIGCTTNPFLKLKKPSEMVPVSVFDEEPEAPELPESAPLVIEIVDSGFPVEYFVKSLKLEDTLLKAFSQIHRKDFIKKRLDYADSTVIFWENSQTVIKSELAAHLREEFPSAIVIISTPSFSERLAEARTLPDPIPMEYMIGDLGPRPFADIVVDVDLQQGNTGEDANYSTTSFGRYIGLAFFVYENGDKIPFHFSFSESKGDEHYNELLAGFNAPITEADKEKMRNDMIKGARMAPLYPNGAEFISEFYTNVTSPGRMPDSILEYHARMNRSPLKYRWMGRPKLTIPKNEFQSWTPGQPPSPLDGFYEWTSDEIAENLNVDRIVKNRVTRLSTWAEAYEKDASVLKDFGEAAAVGKVPESEKAKALSQLFQTEMNYLSRYGKVLVEDPLEGEYADFIKESWLEQEKMRTGFQNKLLFANTIGFAGAGLGFAGGAAALTSGQALIQNSKIGIQNAIATDKETARQLGKVIEENVGPLSLTLGNEQVEVKAANYTELQEKLKALYERL